MGSGNTYSAEYMLKRMRKHLINEMGSKYTLSKPTWLGYQKRMKKDPDFAAKVADIIAEAAAQYNLTPAQVEAALFADLAEEQILLDTGDPIGAGDLIARYNLEVARGLLYWAREVRLRIYDNYKDIFKFVKLFKLMFTVRQIANSKSQAMHVQNPKSEIQNPTPPGYHITLHGPISPFVTSTIRYGLQFAKFMPALMLCDRWEMEADVQPPGIPRREPLRYTLDAGTDLRTHFKSSGPFDSRLEADFAAEFEEKYGGAERVWELAREDELIITGDTVMVPDFSFTHRKDGRRALLEIVGFWHPNYLRRKLEKVRQAGRSDLILLVYKSANVAEEDFEAASAGEVPTAAPLYFPPSGGGLYFPSPTMVPFSRKAILEASLNVRGPSCGLSVHPLCSLTYLVLNADTSMSLPCLCSTSPSDIIRSSCGISKSPATTSSTCLLTDSAASLTACPVISVWRDE